MHIPTCPASKTDERDRRMLLFSFKDGHPRASPPRRFRIFQRTRAPLSSCSVLSVVALALPKAHSAVTLSRSPSNRIAASA